MMSWMSSEMLLVESFLREHFGQQRFRPAAACALEAAF